MKKIYITLVMTQNQFCNKSKTKVATRGEGTVYPSEAPECTPCYQWGSYCSIISFLYDVLLIVYLSPFFLSSVLSVLLRFSF